MSKVLKESEIKLDNDLTDFTVYVDEQKRIQKEMDRILFENMKENRELIEKKRKLGPRRPRKVIKINIKFKKPRLLCALCRRWGL